MVKLTKKYYDSGIRALPVADLDEVLAYRGDLATLFGVDCNQSYRFLAEGLYPIDVNPEHLAKLTTTTLPENIDELIDWKGEKMIQFAGFINRWTIFILGENSRRTGWL